MKLNWGLGIALFYSTFALAMIGMVIKSTQYDHSLVREDYYQADLAYQQQYDKMVNEQTKLLGIEHQAGETSITIQAKADVTEAVKGSILFFRPNDIRLDFSLPIKLDADGQQHIPTEDLVPGRWKLKMDYQVGEKAYYSETEIVL